MVKIYEIMMKILKSQKSMTEAIVASSPHVFWVFYDRSRWCGYGRSSRFKHLLLLFRISPLCMLNWILYVGRERTKAPKEITLHGLACVFPFVLMRVDVQLWLFWRLFLSIIPICTGPNYTSSPKTLLSEFRVFPFNDADLNIRFPSFSLCLF